MNEQRERISERGLAFAEEMYCLNSVTISRPLEEATGLCFCFCVLYLLRMS